MNTENKNFMLMSLIFLSILANTTLPGIKGISKQDFWLPVLLSILVSLPAVLMFSRIIKLNQGSDIFTISTNVLGKFLGYIFNLIFIFFIIFISVRTLGLVTSFIHLDVLDKTPVWVIGLLFVLVCSYAANKDLFVLGRSAIILFFVTSTIIITLFCFLLKSINFDFLKPMFTTPPLNIAAGSFQIAATSFLDIFVFLAVYNAFGKVKKPSVSYVSGLLSASFIIVIVSFANLLTMGPNLYYKTYFPVNIGIELIEAGTFFHRIEVTASTLIFFFTIVKLSICIYAGSMGIKNITHIKNYRKIILPFAISILTLTLFFANKVFNIIFILENYYWVFLFAQIFCPFIIWIFSEIKNKKAHSLH